jgi:hypothetical protein
VRQAAFSSSHGFERFVDGAVEMAIDDVGQPTDRIGVGSTPLSVQFSINSPTRSKVRGRAI